MIDATLLVRVTGEMKAWLDDLSRTSGVPRAEIVRRALGAVMNDGNETGSGLSSVEDTGGSSAATEAGAHPGSQSILPGAASSATSRVSRSRLPKPRPGGTGSQSQHHVHRAVKMMGNIAICECDARKVGTNRWVEP